MGHHSIYQRLSCLLPVWGRSKKQASIENRGDDRRQRPDCLPCPRLGKMCPVYSSLPSGHNSSRTSKDPILHSALAPILAASDGRRAECGCGGDAIEKVGYKRVCGQGGFHTVTDIKSRRWYSFSKNSSFWILRK